MEFLISFYDNALIYYPNIFFVVIPFFFLAGLIVVFRVIFLAYSYIQIINIKGMEDINIRVSLKKGDVILNNIKTFYRKFNVVITVLEKKYKGIEKAISKELFIDEN